MQRRSYAEMKKDILASVVDGPLLATVIMTKANMNYTVVSRLIKSLTEKKLLVSYPDGTRTIYGLSLEGKRCLELGTIFEGWINGD